MQHSNATSIEQYIIDLELKVKEYGQSGSGSYWKGKSDAYQNVVNKLKEIKKAADMESNGF